jgi:hypothetical protein
MSTINIHYGDGIAPYTDRVYLCDADSEIAGNSLYADEAQCLKEFNSACGIPSQLRGGLYRLVSDDGETSIYEPVESDPTPWCSGCGAMKRTDCHCGPIAENE